MVEASNTLSALLNPDIVKDFGEIVTEFFVAL